MKKYIKELCVIAGLLIILISIWILIYIKKGTLKKEAYDLVGTKWNLNKVVQYKNETMSEEESNVQLFLNFMENHVSICTFYEDNSVCSMSEYYRDDSIYVVSKGDYLDINGVVTFDENGSIQLEQTIDNNSKIIYYFERGL